MAAIDNSNCLEDSDIPNALNKFNNPIDAGDFEYDESTRGYSCTSSSHYEVPRIFSSKSSPNKTPTATRLKTKSSKKEDPPCAPPSGFFQKVMENAKSILSIRCSAGNEEPTKDIEEKKDLSVGDGQQWSTGSSKCVEFHTSTNTTDSVSCMCDESSGKIDTTADTYTNDLRDEAYTYSKNTTPSTCSCKTSASSGNLYDISKNTISLKSDRDVGCRCSIALSKETSEETTSCNCSYSSVTSTPPAKCTTSCGCCTSNVVVSNKNYQFSVDQSAAFCQCSLPKPPMKDTKGLQKSFENVECCRCRINRYSDTEKRNIAMYKSHMCPGCSSFHNCPSCAANSKKAIETKAMATAAMTKELKDRNIQFGQPCPVKVDRCITTPNISLPNRVNPNIPAPIRSDRRQSCSEHTCPAHPKVTKPNSPIANPIIHTSNFMNQNIAAASRSERTKSCTQITRPASNFKDEDNQCAFLGSPIIGSSTTRNIAMTKSVGVECACIPKTRSNQMIAELNEQERNFRSQIEVFAERGKHYDDAFNNYQHMMNRPPCCCRPTDRGDHQFEIQRISRELQLENKTMRAEIMEMKMELKHTLENVEGPMKHKLEMERVKCEKLQYDLSDASRNRMDDRNSHMKEMNSLRLQLCCACSNMTELSSINQRLKEELNSLDCMCNKLEDDIIKHKLSEADTIRKLTKKMPCSCSQDKENPFDSMFNSGQVSKDSFNCESNLHTIARKLSRTLKESAPCEECSQLPEELAGAAKCIKELSDLVQSKKASFSKDSSRDISKDPSKKDCSSQSKPLTGSTGCQCLGQKDANTGESRVTKESSPRLSPFSKDSFKCDSNLDAIARKLSKTIKESAPCEECSQFPPELTGAAKYIKDLTDLVQSRKVQQRDASAGGSRATSPRRRQDTATKTIFAVPPDAFVEMDDSTQMMKPSDGADTRAQSSYFSAQSYNPCDAACEAPCAPPRPPNVYSFGNQKVSETAYAPPKVNKAYSFGGPGKLQVCECPGAPMKPKVTRSEVCEAPCAQSKQTKVSIAEVCEAPCASLKSVSEPSGAPPKSVSEPSGPSPKSVSEPSGTKATEQDLGVKHADPPGYADGIPFKRLKLSDELKIEADGDMRDVKPSELIKEPTPELVKEEEKEITKVTSEVEETLGSLTDAPSEAVTTGVEFTETATSESQTKDKVIIVEEPEVSETIEEKTTEVEEIVDTQVVPEKIPLEEPCDAPCKDVMPCDKMGAPCMQRKKAAEKDVDYSEVSSKVQTKSVERGSDPIEESAISTLSEVQAVTEPEDDIFLDSQSASFVERGSDPMEVSREEAVIEPAEVLLLDRRQQFADLGQQTIVLEPQTADLGQQTVSVVEPPAAVVPQPVIVESQPVAVVPEQVAVVSSPVAAVPQAIAVELQPVAVVPQAVAVVPSPVAVVPSPVAVVPSPVAVVPSPVAVVPSPVADVPSPVAVVPSPVAVVPSPVAAVPSPVAVVPSPVAVVPSPVAVVEQPVPIVASPVPVIPSPVAVVPSPVAVVPSPVPVVQQPVAVVEKSIIVERGSDPIVDIKMSEMPEMREATIATEELIQERKPSFAGQAITGTYSGTFPFLAETKFDTMDEPPAGLQVTTTVTSSGNLEVITEGAEGIIETTLIYRDDGTIEVITEITEFPGEMSTEPLTEPSKSLTKSERRSRASGESKNLFEESFISGTFGLTDVDSTYADPTLTTAITQADDEMPMDTKDVSVESETGRTLEQQTSSVPVSIALTDKMSSEETAIGTEEIQQEDKEGGTADELEIAAIVTEEISYEDKIGSIPDESDDRGMGTEEICLEDQSQFAIEESDDRAIATEMISQQDQDGSSPDKADITAATSSIPMAEIGTDETTQDVMTEALKAQTSDFYGQSSVLVDESCQCCECKEIGVSTSKDIETITEEDSQPKSETDQVATSDSEYVPARDVKEEGDTLGSLQEVPEPTNDKDVGTTDIPVDERNREASVQSSDHGQGESPRRSEDKKLTEVPESQLQSGSSGERKSPKRRSSKLSDSQCDCPGVCQCVVCSPEIINKRLATTGSSKPPGGKTDQICCCNLNKEKTSSSERRRSVPPQTAQVYLQTELSKPKVEVGEKMFVRKYPVNCTCADCICKPCAPCPQFGPSATEDYLKSTNLEVVQSPPCKCDKKTVDDMFEAIDAKTSTMPRSTADIATSEIKSRSDDKTPTIPESDEKSTADIATSEITRPIQEAGEQTTISTEFKATSPRISTPKHSPDSIPEDSCDCPWCKCLEEEATQAEISKSFQYDKLQTIDEKGDSVCECPLCLCVEGEEEDEEATQTSKDYVPKIFNEVVETDTTTTTLDKVVETDEKQTVDAEVSPSRDLSEKESNPLITINDDDYNDQEKTLSRPSSEIIIQTSIKDAAEPIEVEEKSIKPRRSQGAVMFKPSDVEKYETPPMSPVGTELTCPAFKLLTTKCQAGKPRTKCIPECHHPSECQIECQTDPELYSHKTAYERVSHPSNCECVDCLCFPKIQELAQTVEFPIVKDEKQIYQVQTKCVCPNAQNTKKYLERSKIPIATNSPVGPPKVRSSLSCNCTICQCAPCGDPKKASSDKKSLGFPAVQSRASPGGKTCSCPGTGPCTCGAGVCPMEDIQRQLNDLKNQLTNIAKLKERPSESSKRQIKIMDEDGECDCEICECAGTGEKPSNMLFVQEECNCEVCDCPGATQKMSGRAAVVDEECNCQICECSSAPGIGDKVSTKQEGEKLTCDCEICRCIPCPDPSKRTSVVKPADCDCSDCVCCKCDEPEDCTCQICECPNKEIEEVKKPEHPDDCTCEVCKCPEEVTQTEREDAPAEQAIGDAQTECICDECACPGEPPKKETGVGFRQNAVTHPEGCTCEECKCSNDDEPLAEKKEETTDTETHPADCICDICSCAEKEKHQEGCPCPECVNVDCFFKTNVELHAMECKCADCCCQECIKPPGDASPKGDGCKCEICKCKESQETTRKEAEVVAKASVTTASCQCIGCACPHCADKLKKDTPPPAGDQLCSCLTCLCTECSKKQVAGGDKSVKSPDCTCVVCSCVNCGTNVSQAAQSEICHCDNCSCVCAQKRGAAGGVAGNFGVYPREKAPSFSAPRRTPCTCSQCTCVRCIKEGGQAPEAMSYPQLGNKTQRRKCDCPTCTCTPAPGDPTAERSQEVPARKPCDCPTCTCVPVSGDQSGQKSQEAPARKPCDCPTCTCVPASGDQSGQKSQEAPARETCHCPTCSCADEIIKYVYGGKQENVATKASKNAQKDCVCDKCACPSDEEVISKPGGSVSAKQSTRRSASEHPDNCDCPICSCQPVCPEKVASGTRPSRQSQQGHQDGCDCPICACTPTCPEKVASRAQPVQKGQQGQQGHQDGCDCPKCACTPECPEKVLSQAQQGQQGQQSHHTDCKCPSCACKPPTEEVVRKSVDEVTKPNQHEEGCTCPSCCRCSASKVEMIDISKLDNVALMKKIETDRKENCECREQIKDIKRALNKIKCACIAAEMKAIKNTKLANQASSFGQTMSDLKVALCNLQDKCKAKDRMIEAMTGELKLRTSSDTFDKVINASGKDAPDYDKADDVRSLEECEGKRVSINEGKGEQKNGDIKMAKAIDTKKSSKDKSKSGEVCKCGKSNRDNKPNQNVNLQGFEVTDIRRVTQDSIIIRWKLPNTNTVIGYDIFVNGVNKSKIMSGGRTSAMIHSLDLTATFQITIYAVTKCGRCEPPAIAIYETK